MTKARVLVVDDEEGVREFLEEVLVEAGYDVTSASDGDEGHRLVTRRSFDVILTDLAMPGRSGLELLETIRTEQPEAQVVMLTAHGNVETAVRAMRIGAFDFVEKPIASPAALRLLVERALERRTLLAAVERSERDGAPDWPLTYGDAAMRTFVDALGKVARTSATVLLLGESGTGKEVAARAIHRRSARASGPFMALNCACLSETLLESELFGHERGAFTGATAQRRGRLELAEGGTFFLDEIGELRPELQARLLRVIEERAFERVGGTRLLRADVRFVAATNRDLAAAVADGRFRDDLFHRIGGFPLRIPPLRERRDDLVPLASALLERICRDLGVAPRTFADDVRDELRAASLRGNVRELRNAIERAVILTDGTLIRAADLCLELEAETPSEAGSTARATGRSLVELERVAIMEALARTNGNRRATAESLGIGRRTLYEKLRRYGIE